MVSHVVFVNTPGLTSSTLSWHETAARQPGTTSKTWSQPSDQRTPRSGKPGWLFNPRLLRKLEKVKDSTGRHLADSDLLTFDTDGGGGTLLRFRFSTSTQVPISLTTGSSSDTSFIVLSSDWDEAWIGENQSLEIDASDSATYSVDGGLTICLGLAVPSIRLPGGDGARLQPQAARAFQRHDRRPPLAMAAAVPPVPHDLAAPTARGSSAQGISVSAAEPTSSAPLRPPPERRADTSVFGRWGTSDRHLRDLRRLHDLLDEIAAEELRSEARAVAAEGLRRSFPAASAALACQTRATRDCSPYFSTSWSHSRARATTCGSTSGTSVTSRSVPAGIAATPPPEKRTAATDRPRGRRADS